MGLDRKRMVKVLGVSALLAVPLLCGQLYFQIYAPGQQPGVYLESGDGLFTLSGYSADRPGSSGEAVLKSPVIPDGPPVAFYIVGPRESPLAANATSATLWCFVVDADAPFRAQALPVPATVRQINPRAYRISAAELKKPWGPESVPFKAFQQALARTRGSRTAMAVMIGLEVQASAAGPRQMYSVRVGPPQ
jgi:hypothetical protein